MTQEQDIVERLDWEPLVRDAEGLQCRDIMREAAQTIAALRAERDEALSAVESDRDQWKELAKEGANIAAVYLKERDEARKALDVVNTWAEQRCPCFNETPNPCPLCGASVENLEPCKSAENTMPRHVLDAIRNIRRARSASSNREGGEE